MTLSSSAAAAVVTAVAVGCATPPKWAAWLAAGRHGKHPPPAAETAPLSEAPANALSEVAAPDFRRLLDKGRETRARKEEEEKEEERAFEGDCQF